MTFRSGSNCRDVCRNGGDCASEGGRGHLGSRHVVPHCLGNRRRVAVALLATAALAMVFWPGRVLEDATEQLRQATSGQYNDWHPAAFAWIWRQLLPLSHGPAPMFVLQLGAYWLGFGLLACAALRRGRGWLAAAVLACALHPVVFFLMGFVLKDSLLTGMLVVAAGLMASKGKGSRLAAAIVLLAATTLRANAFFATIPLAVGLLPVAWRRTWPRLAAATLAAAVPLVLVVPVINRLLDVKPSGVEVSLILFDLGGISKYSGVDVLPPMPVADIMAENRRCYTPIEWDNYGWGMDPPCRITPALFRQSLATQGLRPIPYWIRAIVRHPAAYAVHRFGYYNRNIRWLVLRKTDRPGWTPIGWPVLFLGLAASAMRLSARRPSRAFVWPLALSGLLYSAGYLPVGVASDLRYSMWTILAAMLAFAFAVDSRMADGSLGRRELVRGSAPFLFLAATATLWRLGALALGY